MDDTVGYFSPPTPDTSLEKPLMFSYHESNIVRVAAVINPATPSAALEIFANGKSHHVAKALKSRDSIIELSRANIYTRSTSWH